LNGCVVKTVPGNTHAYVCTHVFDEAADVLLVSRPEGDWCLLCGAVHGDSAEEYRVVGIGHLLERDPTLRAVMDLEPDWEAEREQVGKSWVRTRLDEEQ
jgi:hypothetical protein